MTNSLTTIFKAIASAKTELELHESVMPLVGEYFAAKRYRLFLVNRLPSKISGLFKQAVSPVHNPVLNYLVNNHATVHEGILVTTSQWQAICPRSDHGHVMVGPIVARGKLIGGLGITRDRHTVEFNSQDLIDMSALSLHLSTQLAIIQSQEIKLVCDKANTITPRETEIARLVAQGLTNAQIGKRLWITENSVKQALKRIFRKLEVSSRTAMVARLTISN